METLTIDEIRRPTLSGELPVKSQCVPFGQIPHTTRLFADFLAYSPSVRQFYPRSPRPSEWMKDEAASLHYDSARRLRVADILDRQNRTWGAPPKTLTNIERLRKGAFAIVSGQQVGLFGGPLLSFFKVLMAAKLAEQANQTGIDCVPVFWLATTDHDLEEINHVAILNATWELQELRTSTQGIASAPVGGITFGQELQPVLEAVKSVLGESEVSGWLQEAYSLGEMFGSAFAKLCTRLFAEWGVIFLDAADPELHRVAEPVYCAAIERASEINNGLLERGTELESAGYHQQVKVTPLSTLLFALRDGSRVPVHRHGDTEFEIEGNKISRSELLEQLRSGPENFSANALLRPVVQDYLLPTIAYAGGPAEVAYFAQAAVVYESVLNRITPIVPRFSATILEAKPQMLMERYKLHLPDVFEGPESLRERIAMGTLPKDLQNAFDQAGASLEKSLAAIRTELQQLDPTLVDSATTAASKMQYQLSQLQAKAARAELRQTEVLGRHAQILSNTLYPKKTLQEREIAGVYFVARQGIEFLREVYNAIDLDCLDHQVISL
jgi:bacillithiol synthase